MVGAVLIVTDLLFDAVAVVVATTGLAAVGCAVFWCLAPLLRRANVRARNGAATQPAGLAATPERKSAATAAAARE
jgi:hypothetical protein